MIFNINNRSRQVQGFEIVGFDIEAHIFLAVLVFSSRNLVFACNFPKSGIFILLYFASIRWNIGNDLYGKLSKQKHFLKAFHYLYYIYYLLFIYKIMQ